MKKQLTMIVNGGLFILGELQGNRLLLPRVFQVIKDGKEIMLSPLHFTPLFIMMSGFASYPVPEKGNENIYELYERVTDPAKIAASEKALEEKKLTGPRVMGSPN